MDNVGLMHRSCGKKRKEEWQEANKGKTIEVNKHCKLEFGEGNNVEHMWVLVKEANNTEGKFSGTIDNDPLFTHAHGHKYGETVDFKFEDIEAYYE